LLAAGLGACLDGGFDGRARRAYGVPRAAQPTINGNNRPTEG